MKNLIFKILIFFSFTFKVMATCPPTTYETFINLRQANGSMIRASMNNGATYAIVWAGQFNVGVGGTGAFLFNSSNHSFINFEHLHTFFFPFYYFPAIGSLPSTGNFKWVCAWSADSHAPYPSFPENAVVIVWQRGSSYQKGKSIWMRTFDINGNPYINPKKVFEASGANEFVSYPYISGALWTPYYGRRPIPYYLISWWYQPDPPISETDNLPEVKLYKGVSIPTEVTGNIIISLNGSNVLDFYNRVTHDLFNDCRDDLRAGISWPYTYNNSSKDLRYKFIAFTPTSSSNSSNSSIQFEEIEINNDYILLDESFEIYAPLILYDNPLEPEFELPPNFDWNK